PRRRGTTQTRRCVVRLALITPVRADAAGVEPPAFEAETTARTLDPTSVSPGVKVGPVAPSMSSHVDKASISVQPTQDGLATVHTRIERTFAKGLGGVYSSTCPLVVYPVNRCRSTYWSPGFGPRP